LARKTKVSRPNITNQNPTNTATPHTTAAITTTIILVSRTASPTPMLTTNSSNITTTTSPEHTSLHTKGQKT
jgi:hypothetical protein